jgi:hypothetical protein
MIQQCSIARTDLLATLTVVALHDRLGVEPLFLEAGLPLLALVLHHQLLHAVDETEMHVLQPTTASYHIKKFSRLGAVTRTLTTSSCMLY